VSAAARKLSLLLTDCLCSCRFPAPSKFSPSDAKHSLKLNFHSSGPVSVSFMRPGAANSYRLVTVGQLDGCVMVWTLIA